jgi:hypothetical protein
MRSSGKQSDLQERKYLAELHGFVALGRQIYKNTNTDAEPGQIFYMNVLFHIQIPDNELFRLFANG